MFELIGMVGLILLVSVIIVGVLYQFICAKRDKRVYSARGEMIDMGQHRFLHVVHKTISENSPTVILEAGNGLSSSSWMLVQPEIEKFANCLSYDRAGFGWSQPNPNSRDSLNDVRNLHHLLSKLNMPKPYILVGHSYGGMLNLLYANQYPEEVAGIILVDAYHEEQLKIIPLPSPTTMVVLRIMTFLGIFRLLINKLFPLPKSLPSQMRKRIQAEITAYTWAPTMSKIFSNAEKSLLPLKNLPTLNQPLVVISAGLHSGLELKFEDRICELQRDLVKRSVKGHQIIAEKSEHNIPFSQPELIVAAVSKMSNDYLTPEQLHWL